MAVTENSSGYHFQQAECEVIQISEHGKCFLSVVKLYLTIQNDYLRNYFFL